VKPADKREEAKKDDAPGEKKEQKKTENRPKEKILSATLSQQCQKRWWCQGAEEKRWRLARKSTHPPRKQQPAGEEKPIEARE